MKLTNKMENNFLINVQTGEVISLQDSDDSTIAEGYKQAIVKYKELESLLDSFKQAILDRIPDGERKFSNYLDIRYIHRKKLNLNQLDKHVLDIYNMHKEQIRTIEEAFGKEEVIPQIWMPKLI